MWLCDITEICTKVELVSELTSYGCCYVKSVLWDLRFERFKVLNTTSSTKTYFSLKKLSQVRKCNGRDESNNGKNSKISSAPTQPYKLLTYNNLKNLRQSKFEKILSVAWLDSLYKIRTQKIQISFERWLALPLSWRSSLKFFLA